MSSEMSPRWPAHGIETLLWQQQVLGGTKEDRMMRSVDATVPPFIAELDCANSLCDDPEEAS